VFLVDGGKGQLAAALDALESLGIQAPCVISLAKREEEVFLPGHSEPLRLSRDSYSLRLLEYVRDEAHRFAQHYHHLLRGRRMLDDEPG
jgi:excinuclease ABC subunit C